MKTKILLSNTALLLLMFYITPNIHSQMIVNDPENLVEAINIVRTMKKVKDNTEKLREIYNTASIIKDYKQFLVLLDQMEESYCVLKDLDYYINLSDYFKKNQECIDELKYAHYVALMEDAIWGAANIINSTNLTAAERIQILGKIRSILSESNQGLNSIKNEIKADYKAQENYKQSKADLNLFW